MAGAGLTRRSQQQGTVALSLSLTADKLCHFLHLSFFLSPCFSLSSDFLWRKRGNEEEVEQKKKRRIY